MEYANKCDSSVQQSGKENSACDSGTHNCADISSDTSVGREDRGNGEYYYMCDDGIDNDCYGSTDGKDNDDGDCWISNCDRPGDVSLKCEHNSGDRSGDDNTDGYYCSKPGSSVGRCCPTGWYWNGNNCEEFDPCYDAECPYEPFTGNWWNSNACITAGDACCPDSTQYGEKWYSWKSVSSY